MPCAGKSGYLANYRDYSLSWLWFLSWSGEGSAKTSKLFYIYEHSAYVYQTVCWVLNDCFEELSGKRALRGLCLLTSSSRPPQPIFDSSISKREHHPCSNISTSTPMNGSPIGGLPLFDYNESAIKRSSDSALHSNRHLRMVRWIRSPRRSFDTRPENTFFTTPRPARCEALHDA